MPLPPDPTVPDALLTAAARLSFVPIRPFTDFGYLLEEGGAPQALYLDRGERWGLYAPTSPGLGPFLVQKLTAKILRGGKLATDGAIVHDGVHYRIQATCESGHLIACAVPA